MKNKFDIKEILNIKFYDIQTGEEVKDIRDKEPIERKFNPNIPILDLVKSCVPSYQICNHPLLRKYGYDTFGMVCENWYWTDNLAEASEDELWKIYALIQADWLVQYEYMYRKEVYEFRKFKREHKPDKTEILLGEAEIINDG